MKKIILVLVALVTTVVLVNVVATRSVSADVGTFGEVPRAVGEAPRTLDPAEPARFAGNDDDVYEPDMDGDFIDDDVDNCIEDYNHDQRDTDNDGVGNICDNCRFAANPDQVDSDDDNIGDACVEDADLDGIMDDDDNCPTVSNPDQANEDHDFYGDACDVEAAPGASTDEPDDEDENQFNADHNGGCSLVIEGSNTVRGFGMSVMFLFGAIAVALDRRRRHEMSE